MKKPDKRILKLFRLLGLLGILLLAGWLASLFWFETAFNGVQVVLSAAGFVLVTLSLVIYKNGLSLFDD